MNKHILNKIALVVGGAAIGSGVTFLVVNNQLKRTYQQTLQDEIKNTKEFYLLMHSKAPYDDPATALALYNERMDQLEFWSANGIPDEEYEEPEIFNEMLTDEQVAQQLIEDNQYSIPDEGEPEKKVSDILKRATDAVNYHDVVVPKEAKTIIHLDDVAASPADIPDVVTGEQEIVPGNVFTNYVEPPEEVLRDKEFPYVISEDEFHTTEQQYDGVDLMYYLGGREPVLADLQGQVVHDIVGLLGKDTLKHLGHDEKNPDTLYVRNDKRKVNIEITREERSYAEVVLGIVSED